MTDKRKLVGIVSPPYEDGIKGGKSGIEWQSDWGTPSASRQPSQNMEYGKSKQNIGNLPDRKIVGITSPPFLEAQEGGGINIKGYKDVDPVGDRTYTRHMSGANPNNISNLPDRKIVGITSPPFEDMDNDGGRKMPKDYFDMVGGIGTNRTIPYGSSQGQMGLLKSSNNSEDFDITSFHSCDESLVWTGCYGSDAHFKKFIDPETYSHPAKMSLLLGDRIIQHLKKLGLLDKNSLICDFMAGTGRTGILASLHGFDFVGVELEPHFIEHMELNYKKLKEVGQFCKCED